MNRSHIEAGKYHWRTGVHLPVSAQQFGEWVSSLPDQQPPTIVAHARDPKCFAHRLFNWNDREAAHEQRLMVARRLYGLLVVEAVVYKNDKPHVYQLRAIVKGGPDEPYEPIAKVLAQPDKRSYRLAQALKELSRVRQEYSALNELALVFSEIDNARKRHGRVMRGR